MELGKEQQKEQHELKQITFLRNAYDGQAEDSESEKQFAEQCPWALKDGERDQDKETPETMRSKWRRNFLTTKLV